MVRCFPTTIPRPLAFAALLALSCLTSIWKVNFRSAEQRLDALGVVRGGSDGAPAARPAAAMVVAVAGAWTQCTFNVRQPLSAVPHDLQHGRRSDHDAGDRSGLHVARRARRRRCTSRRCRSRWSARSPRTFFVNTGLVAGAIALVHAPVAVEGVARQFSLERSQLHGGRRRRRARPRS